MFLLVLKYMKCHQPSCVFHVICDNIKKNCSLTPRFNGSKMVAPPGGVHCVSSDLTRKARYLLTHFDRFQALIIIFVQVHTRSACAVDTACEVWSS